MSLQNYNRTTWENSPSEQTPLNADNLNNIEGGIERATGAVQTLERKVPAKASDLDSDSGYCTPQQVQEVLVNYLLDGKIWIDDGKLCFTDMEGQDWIVYVKGDVR